MTTTSSSAPPRCGDAPAVRVTGVRPHDERPDDPSDARDASAAGLARGARAERIEGPMPSDGEPPADRPPAARPPVAEQPAPEQPDSDQSTTELAAELAAGSRDALAEIYRRWSGLVHTIAYRSLGNEHDAEDVTQQVFVSAWNGRHSLRPEQGSLAAWLVGITRHRVADARTQRYRQARNLAAVGAQVATAPTASHDDWAQRLLLVHELEQMGDPRATVLRMAFMEDRPHPEIAAALNLPLGTVKSHVRRGLIELRLRLKEVERVSS